MSDANNTTSTETADDGSDATTTGFYSALYIGAAVGIVLLLLFSYLRTRVPDVFNVRALLNTWKTYNDFNGKRVGVVQPAPSDSFFGWLKPTFQVSEEEVLNKIGLDAAMFLRFIRTSFFICGILSLFGLIFVMPVFGTADGRDVDRSIAGLKIVTVSNVLPSSSRFWVVVVAEFFTAAVVMYFLSQDYKHYADLRRKYRSTETPANYSIVVYDIPAESRNEQAVRERFDQLVPGRIATVHIIKNPSNAIKFQKKLDNAVNKRETAEYILSTKNKEPQVRPGPLGAINCAAPKVDAIPYWSQEQDKFANKVSDEESEADPTPSAIIVCTNKRTASMLVQANSRTDALTWYVERAPEPNAIHWGSMSTPGYQAELRTIAVAVFIFFFTIFWTIPATAIVGLASLKTLSDVPAFSWARPMLDWSPELVGLIEGLLPPVVTAVLLSLIPPLFRAVVSLERISSVGQIEMKTRDYFFMFTLYGTFFVYLIGASFFRDLEKLRKDWIKIIDLLAAAVPESSVYYSTFIILKCLIPFTLLHSGLVRCVLRWVKLKWLAKTERQKRAARVGGSAFVYFRQYGFGMLTLFLCLAFSSIAPLVNISGTIYFGLAYVCFRYTILFASYNPWDGGGELYPGTFWGTMLGLMLKQAVVITVLSLKKAAGPVIACFFPLIITVCFTFIVNKRYQDVAKHGSLLDFYEEGKEVNEVPSAYQHVYEQPAGKITNYENLNGVVEAKDVYGDVEVGRVEDQQKVDAVHPDTFDDNVGYVPDPAADRDDI